MSSRTPSLPGHLSLLQDNLGEVTRILDIHEEIAGTGVGRKYNVEVLNKSAVILLVACWESYVEDLASVAFDLLIHHASSPEQIPRKVLGLAGAEIRKDPDDTKIWTLAGDGWRSVLTRHRDTVLKKHLGPFNTPRAEGVDALFAALIGLRKASASFFWKGTTFQAAARRLEDLITLRGSVAHTVHASAPVHKKHVTLSIHLVNRLACSLSNRVGEHLKTEVGTEPWMLKIQYNA